MSFRLQRSLRICAAASLASLVSLTQASAAPAEPPPGQPPAQPSEKPAENPAEQPSGSEGAENGPAAQPDGTAAQAKPGAAAPRDTPAPSDAPAQPKAGEGEGPSAPQPSTGGAKLEAGASATVSPPQVGADASGAANAPGVGTKAEAGAATDGGEPGDAELDSLLREVVVAGASQSAEAGNEAPATVEVITATQLRVYGIRTLAEAFNYLSMSVHATPTAGSGEIGARGVTLSSDLGSHTLLVIDGHVVNAGISGYTWFEQTAGIPMASIDRIELIYGAGAVLYGNNAVTLVINVVMKKGEDAQGVDFQFDGALSPATNRYGNFDEFDRSRLGHREEFVARYGDSFKIRGKDADLLLVAGFMHDQRPKAEMGPQYSDQARELFDFGNTGSGDPTVWGGYAGQQSRGPYGYGRFRVGNFTLAGRASWMTADLAGVATDFDNSVQPWSVASVDARYDYLVSSKISGFARVYYDYFKIGLRQPLSADLFCSPTPAPCQVTGNSEEYRGGIENQWSFDWFADARYVTMIGADGRLLGSIGNFWLQDQYGNIDEWLSFGGTDTDDGRFVGGAVGAYAQQLMRVHPKVSLNVGARYDYFLGKQAVSPRGAAVFTPWQGGSLKVIYSQAFRAPAVSESNVNPDLEPEVIRGAEIAVGHTAGAHRIIATAFGSIWNDPIRRSFIADPENFGRFGLSYVNSDNLLQAGGTLGYSAEIQKFSYGVNATYAWVRLRLGGLGGGDLTLDDEELQAQGVTRVAADRFGRNQPLAAAPAFMGNFRLAYAIGPERPTLALTGVLTGPQYVRDAYSDPTFDQFTEDDPDSARTKTFFMGRAVVTQEFEKFAWGAIGYRVAVEAASGTLTPQAIGPFKANTRDNNLTRQLELNQIARLTVFGGFHVNFGRRKAK